MKNSRMNPSWCQRKGYCLMGSLFALLAHLLKKSNTMTQSGVLPIMGPRKHFRTWNPKIKIFWRERKRCAWVFLSRFWFFFWKEVPSQLSAQPEHNWVAMSLVPERCFLPAPASAFFQLVSHVPCSECQCSYKETAVRQGDCQEQEPSALSIYQGVCLCLSVAYSIFQKLSLAPCHHVAPWFLCHSRKAVE